MSSFTETLMEAGDFSIRLKKNTPNRIRQKVREWGMIVITPSRFPSPSRLWPATASFSKTDAMIHARYVGCIDSYDHDRREIRGTNGIVWLGIGDVGPIVSTKVEYTTATPAATFMSAILPRNGISLISVAGAAGSATGSFQYVTVRSVLEQITEATGDEWKIDTDGTGAFGLSVGDAASVFGSRYTTPKAIAVARQGTRELNAIGVHAVGMASSRSGAAYVNQVYALARGDGGTEVGVGTVAGGTSYYGPDGNAIEMGKVIDAPDARRGTAAAIASSVLASYVNPEQSVAIDTDAYRISELVRVGERMYVYDAERGLTDKNVSFLYQGRYFPALKMRVRSMVTPITGGMGVYYFSSDSTNTPIDLSGYVEVDNRPVTRIEVTSTLTRPGRVENVTAGPTGDLPKAVSIDQWRTWTVIFTQTGTLSTSTLSATLTRLGRRVSGEAHGTGGTGGTAGQAIKLTLPVAAAYVANKPIGWWRWYRSAAAQSYGGSLSLSGDGSHAQLNGWTHGPLGNDPNFAPASGDEFYLMFDYEAASS